MTTTSYNRASRWLASAGLRPTRQRMALADVLVGDGGHR
ncbi:MAG: transcriptional repressor, partial [Paracoccaceae bacterium]